MSEQAPNGPDGSDGPQAPPATGEPDGEDQLLLALRRGELRRRLMGALGALALLVAVVLGVQAFVNRGKDARINLPVEEGEEEVLSRTNDPACREMIGQVGAIGKDFFALEADIEAKLLGEDPEAIGEVQARLGALGERLGQAEGLAREATLRFDTSRAQLDRWFPHMRQWIKAFEALGEERLQALGAKGAPAAAVGGTADAGPEVDGGAPTTLEELVQRRDRGLVIVHDDFERFRVWHTSGLHPCGAKSDAP